MLNQSTDTVLRAMKLTGMANELERQCADPKLIASLSFDERLSLIVDAEWRKRQTSKMKKYVNNACLPIKRAQVEGTLGSINALELGGRHGKHSFQGILDEVTVETSLPQELVSLHLMQWLNFVHGISTDMSTKLARHLQKRGCRDAAALPGFEYAIRKQGIAIRKYTGLDPGPRLENEYGGIPVVEIESGAFRNCIHLKSFEIPSGVREIGSRAFENCRSLDRIVIPAGVTEIRYSVFSGCESLSSVTFCGDVTSIGPYAFSGCENLPAIAIPDSVTQISWYAFSGCKSLSDAVLPEGLKRIENEAFKDCAGLVHITIPDRITSIEDALFEGCKSLVSVTFRGKVREIGEKAFRGCSSLASIELTDSLESIGRSAFEGCSALASVTIRGKVPRIEPDTFKNCTGLASVILPDSITEIKESAFENCTALASVNLPDCVVAVGKEAFKNCASLPSVSLPSGLTAVSDSLFEGCERLRSILIPQSVTAIGYKAFSGCRSLVSAVLPDRMEEIAEHLFAGCESLQSVALPETVRKIRQSAFENCRSLKSLTLPDGMDEIDPTAFKGCARLTVFCPPDLPSWRQMNGVKVRYNKPGRPDHPDSPYEGRKPYIFVNHSRRNEQIVFPIIQAMQEKGLLVWYGQDGLAGAAADTVEERLHHSSCSIQFISEEWLRGWYYLKAAETAVNLRKPCLNIFLDESGKYSIDPVLARGENIDQYDLPDADFYRQLFAVPDIRKLLPSFGSRMIRKIRERSR